MPLRPQQKACRPHDWIRNWKRNRDEIVDLCRKCDLKRRAPSIKCPACFAPPFRPGAGVDPHCMVCDGYGRRRAPHACLCCEDRRLAAGAALCRDCLYGHGWRGVWCDKATQGEREFIERVAEARPHVRKPGPLSPAERKARDLT